METRGHGINLTCYGHVNHLIIRSVLSVRLSSLRSIFFHGVCSCILQSCLHQDFGQNFKKGFSCAVATDGFITCLFVCGGDVCVTFPGLNDIVVLFCFKYTTLFCVSARMVAKQVLLWSFWVSKWQSEPQARWLAGWIVWIGRHSRLVCLLAIFIIFQENFVHVLEVWECILFSYKSENDFLGHNDCVFLCE